jgi:exosome complex component RRP4
MSKLLYVPGEIITRESGFLRGHGTYVSEQHTVDQDGEGESNPTNNNNKASNILIASVAGEIERVNRLISIRPLKSRYSGEVGDLVIGRVTTVDSKRWKVDICGQRDGHLQLSSVTLPDGDQRIRTYDDQLTMRKLFIEGDLVCAEIQNVSSDGMISLHTRSLKYGKLENGQLVQVPANLMRRLPQHYISLSCGMDLILGMNGRIWITRTIPKEWKLQCPNWDEMTPTVESLKVLKERHAETDYTMEERQTAARLHNCIQALASQLLPVSPENIMSVYAMSLQCEFEAKVSVCFEL